MTERKMTEYEFARTTYDPILTEKLDQIVNGRGLVDELAPPQPKTLDEVAFGFNLNEVELIADSHDIATLNHKRKIVLQLGRVSAEEMQQAKTTGEFLDEQEKAESEFNSFPYFSSRSRNAPYISAYMWPRERAWYKARALSFDETIGINTDALHKVEEMHEEAHKLNQAYDVVRSNGANVEVPKHDKSPEGRALRGDNMGGMGSFRIPVLRSQNKIYDIQGNSAVRWSEGEGKYVPFASQHQERAIDAMRKAAIKAMDRGDDSLRADAVEKAKETLGRASVKIPKHTA